MSNMTLTIEGVDYALTPEILTYSDSAYSCVIAVRADDDTDSEFCQVYLGQAFMNSYVTTFDYSGGSSYSGRISLA